jgi:hypothetical protein
MNIDNKTMPLIGKWIVKYDEVYQMPQFVQGTLIGDSMKLKNGQPILVRNIESIDLKEKTMKTYDGITFKLVGAGRRMILLGEDELLEIEMAQNEEKWDD